MVFPTTSLRPAQKKGKPFSEGIEWIKSMGLGDVLEGNPITWVINLFLIGIEAGMSG